MSETREIERARALAQIRQEMQQKARQAATIHQMRRGSAVAQAQAKASFERRSFTDRQVALNLAQLAGHEVQFSGLDQDRVETLITTLTVSIISFK